MSALSLAAMKGYTRIVHTLLLFHFETWSGADTGMQQILVSEKDQQGCTPLHFAAMYGHEDVVALLLLCKANTTATDMDGNTPEDLARLTRKKNWRNICYLINNPSMVNGNDAVQKLTSARVKITDKGNNATQFKAKQRFSQLKEECKLEFFRSRRMRRKHAEDLSAALLSDEVSKAKDATLKRRMMNTTSWKDRTGRSDMYRFSWAQGTRFIPLNRHRAGIKELTEAKQSRIQARPLKHKKEVITTFYERPNAQTYGDWPTNFATS